MCNYITSSFLISRVSNSPPPPAHRPPHTASVGLLRFRACGTGRNPQKSSDTGGIPYGQPSPWIMSMLIYCPTPLLVSKTRYFRNPTRNERSEGRVGYADDARVRACRRHATISPPTPSPFGSDFAGYSKCIKFERYC